MKSLKARIVLSSLVVSSMVLLLSGTVSAQVIPTTPTPPPVYVTGPSELFNIIERVVGWVYVFFFVIAMLLILFAAFTYLTSAGDPEKVTKAKNQLIYAGIAVAVALLAYSFTTIVRGIVGQ